MPANEPTREDSQGDSGAEEEDDEGSEDYSSSDDEGSDGYKKGAGAIIFCKRLSAARNRCVCITAA